MNIHYFQHVPFEGLGCIEPWAKQKQNKLSATRFYEDHKLPFIDICEMLIIMGGPMGVYDEDQYQWLTQEKKFIEKAITKGKIVIGICLGAQLIADVLGAKVYKNREKEIGWMPIELTPEGRKHQLLKFFPDTLHVFHWHGDTFDLPAGALHLARSKATEHQAFLYGNNVLGLQFHLECTAESISSLLQHCKHDLTEGPFVQSPEQILSEDHIYINNKLMIKLLDCFK
ncbi:MAG: type 1 glutamine amidotransferase [Cytophagaceae bacterium]|nr:type 1 glutamine amidotransferase [Cytophagaceae bacterium]MDW8456593.1 type 1 glutamine amidotransferase [Cytophagaceae bacterium]